MTLVLLLLLAFAGTSGTSLAGEPTAVPAVLLFAYPSGSTPEMVSDIPCGEGMSGCEAGFGAVGPDEALYFYDFYNNNIKVLDPSRGVLLRLVAGPEEISTWLAPSRPGVPYGIVVARDGGICMLIEALGKYHFYSLEAGRKEWHMEGTVPKATFGIRANSFGRVQLVVGPEGDAYAYFLPPFDRGLAIAALCTPDSEDGVATAYRQAVPGVVGADGLRYEQQVQPDKTSGASEGCRIVARDPSGAIVRSLALRLQAELVAVLADGSLVFEGLDGVMCASPTGEIRATGSWPTVQTEKLMLGRGALVVSPRGRIYKLCYTARGLEVYLLAEGR